MLEKTVHRDTRPGERPRALAGHRGLLMIALKALRWAKLEARLAALQEQIETRRMA